MGDFGALRERLPATTPLHNRPPHDAALSDAIASLRVHPVLEAALHLLNSDLAAAHFLLRHMQAAPAFEAMYLHGILHRIEGDVDNARAWYGDVERSDVFRHVWGGGGSSPAPGEEGGGKGRMGWKAFLDGIEKIHRRGGHHGQSDDKQDGEDGRTKEEDERAERGEERGEEEAEEEEVKKRAEEEVSGVLQWCLDKFGTGKVEDATGVWVQPSDEIRSTGDGVF